MNGNHYFCTTCYYIDDWHIQKGIKGFKKFEFHHAAQNLNQALLNVFSTFRIEIFFFHFFYIASENTGAIEILKTCTSHILGGKLFHIRCTCHIINLCVQGNLRVVDKSVHQLRNTIAFTKCSGL